jgi:hypothetical protein
VLLLLALVGCLNPQPDPFPQNVDVEAPNGAPRRNDGPNDVQFAPSAPAPGNAAGAAAPSPTRSDSAADQPQAPMTATPPGEGGAPDAGAAPPDAGPEFDAAVPANGF